MTISELAVVKELARVSSHHEANELLKTGDWVVVFVGHSVRADVVYKDEEVAGTQMRTYLDIVLGRIR